MTTRVGPLAHLRVLDLTLFAQGPAATGLLADMGAEVIKVERPNAGDPGRAISRVAPGVSAFFDAFNRGKRGVAIDLQAPAGRDVLLRLAERCDVFVHNFRADAMRRLRLSYEDLAPDLPRLIYAEATGLGAEGPEAGRPIVDILGQARGGLVSVTGTDRPAPAGVILSDYLGGMHLLVAILAALEARRETGRGQRVTSSMLGSMAAAQAWDLTAYLWTGEHRLRSGQGHPLLGALYGIYEARDGWVALTGLGGDRFEAFAEAFGRADLVGDSRFATQAERAANGVALRAEIAHALVSVDAREIRDRMDAIGVRCEIVQDYPALAADPQVVANGYVQPVDHPVLGRVRAVGAPVTFSDAALGPPGGAPALGIDTEAVLSESGFEAAEVQALRKAGVIP